jgi:transcriptional regulator with XRE-family HTH domain
MDYNTYKGIPNALKQHRIGLSQMEVAKQFGFKDKTWISHWERGDALPNLISTIKLSKLYNVPIKELFPGLWKGIRL